MQVQITNLAAEEVGSLELADAVFGVEVAGGHPPPGRALAAGQAPRRHAQGQDPGRDRRTGAKLYKQKGTGRARHGSRARQPVPRRRRDPSGRWCATMRPTCPRRCAPSGSKCALSSKVADGKLVVLDEATLPSPRPRRWRLRWASWAGTSTLVITGAEVERNFGLAARNLQTIDVLPAQGLNVYDILRRDTLVLTQDAVRQIEERLA